MHYSQHKPSAEVARFVEFYWMLEDASRTNCAEQRIVPDGRSGIIVNFARPFESSRNGIWNSQPECFFVGQITSPLLLRPSGPARMLGVQFRPQGAAQLLDLPVYELTDSVIALGDLSPRLFRKLNRVRQLPSLTHALAAIDPILRSLCAQTRSEDDLVSFAVNDIERANGLKSIADVANRIGWSTRQLQRRFKDSVGISPKLFGRMQKFQRVLHATEGPAADWTDAAIRCGYFDQAHLIRDFREFTGKTPTALLEREMDLTRRFVQIPSMSHFSKTAGNNSR